MSLHPLPSILLIDDNKDLLSGLVERLREALPNTEADIRTWVPEPSEKSQEEIFRSKVDRGTTLVVTDYDLSPGVMGLFGLSVVAWCQKELIPVGDFSRGNIRSLPKEPNLFELRIPIRAGEDAAFIADVFRGLRDLRDGMRQHPELLKEKRSPSSMLAALLGREHLDSQFADYMSRLGSANSSIPQKIRELAAGTHTPSLDEKERLLTYVLCHVLLNAVLRYPGPILEGRALCAYAATTVDEEAELARVFADARYKGPFATNVSAFWKEDVDAILFKLAEDFTPEGSESFGLYHRAVLEAKLGRGLRAHDCDRCEGRNGGFWCPFTDRPVCLRPDCSVPSSSWVPQGASLARVERDFYDEWAPMLGL